MINNLAKKLPKPIQQKIKRILNVRRRHSIAMSYYKNKMDLINDWIWRDTEMSNFYYKITDSNRDHLAHTISSITNISFKTIIQYFEELENNQELRNHLESHLKNTNYGRDIKIEYGRRLGWYAFVRALKPKVVVETGVDHGTGSCILASALIRNIAEGYEGEYYGTDIRTEAGQLFAQDYAKVGKILYGDSIQSLKKLTKNIDLFINDSDHSADYEYQEYLTITTKLNSNSVILGDNSHVTKSLSNFSCENDRKFIFFAEKPDAHWYPGAGIGISYK